MDALTPDFLATHQEKNLKAIQKMKGVEVVEIDNNVKLYTGDGNLFYAGKAAKIKVGEKKALIYLALSAFVINNVIDKMLKNKNK